MTQDNKDILLKDLCARLPYDVFVNISDIKCVLQPHDISDLIKCDVDIKPYLFPLSSMTEEQIKEYEDALVYHDYVGGGWTMAKTFDDEYVVPYWFVDFCNKHHLDYKGLIPKGLAIDCTNLNIY